MLLVQPRKHASTIINWNVTASWHRHEVLKCLERNNYKLGCRLFTDPEIMGVDDFWWHVARLRTWHWHSDPEIHELLTNVAFRNDDLENWLMGSTIQNNITNGQFFDNLQSDSLITCEFCLFRILLGHAEISLAVLRIVHVKPSKTCAFEPYTDPYRPHF